MKSIQIILPAILCTLIIYISKMELWYYPLSFGLVIGLVNWKKHKYKPHIGILLSIVASLISFWLAFFCFMIFSALREFLINNTSLSIGEEAGIYYLFISAYIIAPIFVFILYRFIFNIPKTKFSFYIIIGSLILLILDFVVYLNYSETRDYSKMLPYIIWQFIMALALQLILNQKELKKIK